MSTIRPVTEADAPSAVELLRELADYEREPEFHLTAAGLREALSGPAPAAFAHVAEAGDGLVGIALWYPTFSSNLGKPCAYLESLYVRPTQRGTGLGKALLSAVARECRGRGLHRLDWSAVDWNHPAISFYKSLGATPVDGLTRFRLAGQALDRAFS